MNKNQINYKRLQEIATERTSQIVFWCGAGLSTEVGYPNWSSLLNDIINNFSKEANDEELREIEVIKTLKRNPWIAFTKIKKVLGVQRFNIYIRTYLERRTAIPKIYEELWRIRPRGIITLNLDSLVARGHSSVFPGKFVNEFNGFQAAQNIRQLQGPDDFIVNMHGTISDQSSWVFTNSELKSLQEKDGYSEFLTTLFGSSVVVFLGISADDVAAGGVLESMVKKGNLDFGDHFWITDRSDSITKEWTDAARIGLINYNHGEHKDVIQLIKELNKLETEEPQEEVIFKNLKDNEISKPDELDSLCTNDLRIYLNHELQKTMSGHDLKEYEILSDFMDEYEESIHKAWFVKSKVEGTIFFEYTLTERIGEGSFGRVYKAKKKDSSDFNDYAIKLLHLGIWQQQDKLKSFRRGVKSHRILCSHEVSNVVKLYDAAEIPSMIVMEYIDGPNLKELVESRQCEAWETRLDIAYSISKVLQKAHSLPERILHRDLRPSNIMFKNFYKNGGIIDIILTDFDFAWHMGAVEGSIARSPAGFLAPEQVLDELKVSTRSALVDSYGFGMNLFFMISGKEPLFRNNNHSNWEELVFDVCQRNVCKDWQSVPIRIARLILNLTRDQQAERWDISQATAEIKRIRSVLLCGETEYQELIAEELFFRTFRGCKYIYNGTHFKHQFSNGLEMTLSFSETEAIVISIIRFTATGSESHSNIKKYLKHKKDHTISRFQKLGWSIIHDNSDLESFYLESKINGCNILALFAENIELFREQKSEYNF